MLRHDLVLKDNELYLVGRCRPTQRIPEIGLFARDTRFLRDLEIRINGSPADVWLTDQAQRDAHWRAAGPGATLQLDARLSTALTLTVSAHASALATLELTIGTDFLDMFDIRGMHPLTRPQLLPTTINDASATLAATGSDGAPITTELAYDAGWSATAAQAGTVTLRRDLMIDERLETTVVVRPVPPGDPLRASDPANGPRLSVPDDGSAWSRFLRQSDADLALLFTSFPDGEMPAAGIPWFIAPFGRDSLITALQTMTIYPERSASTLRALARLQGERDDPYREEQPGKMPHEKRYGDMARSHQLPQTPYYGTVDATALWVMTFARHVLTHDDAALFAELLPTARRALRWLETDGDVDGDGFVEFGGSRPDDTHLSQQGWKDSGDSLHFADGREVSGPVALVEVQGYSVAAGAWLADAITRFGEAAEANALRERAAMVRQRIEDAFWMEGEGIYAQALDGEKRQVDAISSNPGHLLFCGVPSPERASRMITRLMAEDMNGGWGIRTLSSRMATYNPLSYHNGSVWPHDNSLIMAGMVAYGAREAARRVLDQMTALASFTPLWRISELYSGAERVGDFGPDPYPTSCTPQAWAAGTALLGHACLHQAEDPA